MFFTLAWRSATGLVGGGSRVGFWIRREDRNRDSVRHVVARYAGRMLNIHPSLLPKYTGLHTHRRALEAMDKEHGASVHFVTAELDGGPLVLQSKVPIFPGDTEAGLAARVQATEHIIYPKVIGMVADGRLAWDEGSVRLDGKILDAPLVENESAHARQ